MPDMSCDHVERGADPTLAGVSIYLAKGSDTSPKVRRPLNDERLPISNDEWRITRVPRS